MTDAEMGWGFCSGPLAIGLALGPGCRKKIQGAPRMALRRCELLRVSPLLGEGRGDGKRLPGAVAAR
jgi:hypothetical protein